VQVAEDGGGGGGLPPLHPLSVAAGSGNPFAIPDRPAASRRSTQASISASAVGNARRSRAASTTGAGDGGPPQNSRSSVAGGGGRLRGSMMSGEGTSRTALPDISGAGWQQQTRKVSPPRPPARVCAAPPQ
jgi:hypothetical protein